MHKGRNVHLTVLEVCPAMKKEVKTRLKPKGTITTLVKGRLGKVARV